MRKSESRTDHGSARATYGEEKPSLSNAVALSVSPPPASVTQQTFNAWANDTAPAGSGWDPTGAERLCSDGNGIR